MFCQKTADALVVGPTIDNVLDSQELTIVIYAPKIIQKVIQKCWLFGIIRFWLNK